MYSIKWLKLINPKSVYLIYIFLLDVNKEIGPRKALIIYHSSKPWLRLCNIRIHTLTKTSAYHWLAFSVSLFFLVHYQGRAFMARRN